MLYDSPMKDLGTHDDDAKKALIDLVQLHARQLGEHCSTVQILVTVELEGGEEYRQYEFGVGNFLARMAHAREWCIIQDEKTRIWAKNDELSS